MRQWFRGRLTPAGYLVLCGTLFTGVLGLDMNLTVAYQAFCFLFLLLVVSTISALVLRRRVGVERILPKFGTVGVELPYLLTVRNPTGRIQANIQIREILEEAPLNRSKRFRLVLKREDDIRRGQPFGTISAEAAIPPLSAKQTVDVRHRLLPARRGVLRFVGYELFWADPFGLVRGKKRVSNPQTVLVLPQRYWVPPVALPGVTKYNQGGVALASSVGESEEFMALRDYRAGDSFKNIHWKSWAKLGRPIVKEYEDEFFVRHALVLDTCGDPGDAELFEEAVSVAASFACTIPDQDSLLDLLFVGPEAYHFTAGRGLAHPEQMLEVLASVSMAPTNRHEVLEELLMRHVSLVSGVIFLFLQWDDRRQALAQKIKALNIPLMVLVITDQDESELAPGPMVDAPEMFHTLRLGHIAEDLMKL